MQIPISYGKDTVMNLHIPDDNVLGVFNPNVVPTFDETTLIKEALARPVGQVSFDDCRRAALTYDVSIQAVRDEALRVFQESSE